MSWRTSPFGLALRSGVRALGLQVPLARLLGSASYEQSFHDAMMAALRPGDIVWDVGANVGLYTLQFADRAGPGAAVYAFEPSALNIASLTKAVAANPDVRVMPVALGSHDGTVRFSDADPAQDSLNVSAHVVADGGVEIAMRSADSLIAAGEAEVPVFVKIDVEGHELDVIEGMTAMLADRRLETLAVEVHFQQLADRGMTSAPATIERLLRAAGFTVRWTDHSHIIASRRRKP